MTTHKLSHAPEPWTAVESDEYPGRYDIDHAGDGSLAWAMTKEDAERIVACVNACRHIETRFLTGRGIVLHVDLTHGDDEPRFLITGSKKDCLAFAERMRDE